ncbi:heavy metal translocating P-type ATPase [Apibacter raozihei]|uniref:heavy metal translocating P-type ATPase n=1 Tax=Apibacter raozihei TaxID=2500547 RepID=UPI000FE2A169|nr:heavy metal translocating P-type ATPase [Apibacter raozihei]
MNNTHIHTKNTVYIPLENVDSEHCALVVEKGLEKLPEITEHQVELNNRRAKITSDNLAEAIPKAVKEIRDLGYEVSTVKKNFPVMKLSCASCANSSQNILKQLPGIISASVNYANETASVEYIPGLISPEQLKQSLQGAGYDLLIDESEEAQDTLEDIHKNNFKKLKAKTLGAVVFSIPLVVLGMTPGLMHAWWANYAMWLLATPVVFFYGRQFFIGAYKQTKHRSANMDTLVAVSTGIAYIFSVFNTLFPSFWTSRGLESHVYFEASAVVITFVLLGKILEEKAKGNTSSALKKLMGLQPKTVTVVHEGGHQMEMPVATVKPGMILLVKPGEKIAVDGILTSGSSFVDESMISGEPIAVEKTRDSQVFAGTINQKGSFQFRAEKTGGDTLLSQIIKTIQEAQGSKAPVQKLVDKIAGIFVPVVFSVALLSLLLWILWGGSHGFIYGLQCFVTVLVIACPCALGLATPTAVMVGVGKGAEKGILIKDAESLETTKNVTSMILDKTGTITEGKPTVNDCFWLADDDTQMKSILYSIEKSSEHPLADAVVNYLSAEAVTFINDLKIENVSGKGISGSYQNKNYWVGNPSLINEQKIPIPESVVTWIDEKEKQANTVIIFASQEKVLGCLALSDQIKKTSTQAIRLLQQQNIEVYMLTGDNASTAKAIAAQTGIKNYESAVSPQGKIDFVKKLQTQGKVVAMVGDGINDSAALAQANVSIAMGKGSDIAMDTAKMTIISGDLIKVSEAIKLSKQTVTTIKQNLFWAFIYNVIGIPIAAGILYPVNGFLLSPMIAGAAMALSSVSVVTNSLLLKLKK